MKKIILSAATILLIFSGLDSLAAPTKVHAPKSKKAHRHSRFGFWAFTKVHGPYKTPSRSPASTHTSSLVEPPKDEALGAATKFATLEDYNKSTRRMFDSNIKMNNIQSDILNLILLEVKPQALVDQMVEDAADKYAGIEEALPITAKKRYSSIKGMTELIKSYEEAVQSYESVSDKPEGTETFLNSPEGKSLFEKIRAESKEQIAKANPKTVADVASLMSKAFKVFANKYLSEPKSSIGIDFIKFYVNAELLDDRAGAIILGTEKPTDESSQADWREKLASNADYQKYDREMDLMGATIFGPKALKLSEFQSDYEDSFQKRVEKKFVEPKNETDGK